MLASFVLSVFRQRAKNFWFRSLQHLRKQHLHTQTSATLSLYSNTFRCRKGLESLSFRRVQPSYLAQQVSIPNRFCDSSSRFIYISSIIHSDVGANRDLNHTVDNHENSSNPSVHRADLDNEHDDSANNFLEDGSCVGDTEAADLYDISIRYLKGEGVELDQIEGMETLVMASNMGNSQAQYLLARLIHLKEPEKAAALLFKAAKSGHTKAQVQLASFFYDGTGFEKPNTRHAFLWYKEAAEHGNHKLAQFNLGQLYATGGDGQWNPNPKEAVRWYEAAAHNGNIHAQYQMSICYVNGFGVPIDLDLAHQWTEIAARGGFVAAQMKMAEYHKARVDKVFDDKAKKQERKVKRAKRKGLSVEEAEEEALEKTSGVLASKLHLVHEHTRKAQSYADAVAANNYIPVAILEQLHLDRDTHSLHDMDSTFGEELVDNDTENDDEEEALLIEEVLSDLRRDFEKLGKNDFELPTVEEAREMLKADSK